MRSLSFLVFVLVTFLCWGIYGPVLHVGQEAMGADGKLSSLRPFICVGVAYFLIAVLFPMVVLGTKGEKGGWTSGGFFWSFFAGAVGAIGALGIILAFKFNGKPVFVMPLVFGLAPVVNTFLSMLMARTIKEASVLFYIGVLIVACGAAGVLIYKPTVTKHKAHEPEKTAMMVTNVANVTPQDEDENQNESTESDNAGNGSVEEPEAAEINNTKPVDQKPNDEKPDGNPFYVTLFIGLTALCWGAYGPVLHKGQAKMAGSRLRPFLCVGLAYFAIAVIAPLFLMGSFNEPGGWNTSGVMWSMFAGAAGAIGALGIIYAFNFGGKPIFIMPLVFGFAPVINTFTETISKGLFDKVELPFWISLASVIFGAIIVLTNAPKPKPKSAPAVDEK